MFVLSVSVGGMPNRADVCFVLDSSGSIGEDNWPKLLNFVASVVSHLEINSGDHRVAAVSFGSYANVEFYLFQHTTLTGLINNIENIRWKDEMTNTSGGIRTMRFQVYRADRGDRWSVPNVGVVITDGASNRDEHLTGPEADLARYEGISLIVVGVGDQLNMEEVQDIANNDPNNMLLASDFNSLIQLVPNLVNRMTSILGKVTRTRN